MNQIITNAIIVFKNNTRETFNAISIHKNGIYTGYIVSNSKKKKKTFIEHGFIPKNHIKKIFKSRGGQQYLGVDLIDEKMEEKEK